MHSFTHKHSTTQAEQVRDLKTQWNFKVTECSIFFCVLDPPEMVTIYVCKRICPEFVKLTPSFTFGVRSGISTYSWGFNPGVKQEFSFVFICVTLPLRVAQW